jgi:hypothetical protein
MRTRDSAARRIVGAAGGFIVIVVGVMVALAADAWWEDREADERRVAYLHALQADLSKRLTGAPHNKELLQSA